jgi:tight adherence protein B
MDIASRFGEVGAVGPLVLVLLFCAYFLALEALLLHIVGKLTARGQVSKRLSNQVSASEQLRDLIKARQGRGLSASGEYSLPLIQLNRLVVQSGTSWGLRRFPVFFLAAGGTIIVAALVFTGNLAFAVVTGLLAGPILFVFMLAYQRAKRLRKLENQVPEAIDILVRSLRAGHPVPAAVALVARELPDPIGTEFGILADELKFGLDLETAMNNMASRVGQEDIALLVVATGIQAGTGGNLAEILSSIAKVVRERLKLRLRVKAMSAEGRFSAIILSILPFALFGILWIIAPHFYGEIWDLPIVKTALFAAACWLILGNIVMYRMVRFRI